MSQTGCLRGSDKRCWIPFDPFSSLESDCGLNACWVRVRSTVSVLGWLFGLFKDEQVLAWTGVGIEKRRRPMKELGQPVTIKDTTAHDVAPAALEVILSANSRGHYCLTERLPPSSSPLLSHFFFSLPFTNKSLSRIVNGYRSRSWVSYLWGDNLSEDPHTDCSERLFISTIMQDTEGGNLGKITGWGIRQSARLQWSKRVNWVHFPQWKYGAQFISTLCTWKGCASLSRVAEEREIAVYMRGGWV